MSDDKKLKKQKEQKVIERTTTGGMLDTSVNSAQKRRNYGGVNWDVHMASARSNMAKKIEIPGKVKRAERRRVRKKK